MKTEKMKTKVINLDSDFIVSPICFIELNKQVMIRNYEDVDRAIDFKEEFNI